jgi:hypothetical protein
MNGNFLEVAATTLGMDVGYGKLILIYPAKTTVPIANLTHTAINAAIVAGTIVGCIKGWHSAVGAPIAEISVERTATAEMKQIRAEIAQDVLTFESNMANAVVLADLVKNQPHGGFDCILIDDQGNVFGDASITAGSIETMKINFHTKATGSLQHDHATEKVIAVTARYLVKELSVLIAATETELVLSKTLLTGQLSSITTMTSSSWVFVLKLTEQLTGKPFATALTSLELTVSGVTVTVSSAVYAPLTGLLTVTLAGTGLPVTVTPIDIKITDDSVYMKSTRFSIVI